MPRAAAAKEVPKKAKPKKRGPRAYKRPETIPAGEVLKDVNQTEWMLGDTVGKGGFGELYLAGHATLGRVGPDARYVIKIEPKGNGPLFVEQAFYQRVAKADMVDEWKKEHKLPHLGVPKFVGAGVHTRGKKDFRFLVMERFGEDIWKKYLASNKQFTIKVAFTLGSQILDSLEYLHSKGYAHADIKSANILLGHGATEQNKVYLVDYGLTSIFSPNENHREYKTDPKKAHDGTPEFTSRDAHNGVTPSRRGDLEILGYVIVQWLTSSLPWEHKISPTYTDYAYVTNQKTKYMSNIGSFMKACFPKGDHPVELQKFLEYVTKLQYNQKPNYKQIKELFTKAITRSGGRADGKLDFVTPSVPVSSSDLKKQGKKRKSDSDEVNSPKKGSKKRKCDSDEVGSPKKVTKVARGRKPIVSRSAESSSNSDSAGPAPSKGRQRKFAKSPKLKPATTSRKPVASNSAGKKPGRSPANKRSPAAANKSPAQKATALAVKKPLGRPKGVKTTARKTPTKATGEVFTRKRKHPVSVATSSTQTSPGVKQTFKIKKKR